MTALAIAAPGSTSDSRPQLHPMNSSKSKLLPLAVLLIASLATAQDNPAVAQYQGWKQAGALALLTTPEGANLPAGAVLEGFPVLVRLDRDWFDFSKARPNGEDVRFATSA